MNPGDPPVAAAGGGGGGGAGNDGDVSLTEVVGDGGRVPDQGRPAQRRSPGGEGPPIWKAVSFHESLINSRQFMGFWHSLPGDAVKDCGGGGGHLVPLRLVSKRGEDEGMANNLALNDLMCSGMSAAAEAVAGLPDADRSLLGGVVYVPLTNMVSSSQKDAQIVSNFERRLGNYRGVYSDIDPGDAGTRPVRYITFPYHIDVHFALAVVTVDGESGCRALFFDSMSAAASAGPAARRGQERIMDCFRVAFNRAAVPWLSRLPPFSRGGGGGGDPTLYRASMHRVNTANTEYDQSDTFSCGWRAFTMACLPVEFMYHRGDVYSDLIKNPDLFAEMPLFQYASRPRQNAVLSAYAARIAAGDRSA